ncbi:MAG: DUF169 domain-containing protein [Thiogranum sp.]|nr:DUF169 domain-containing protein [Thiogranum sp.]
MAKQQFADMASELTSLLGLASPPLAITFSRTAPPGTKAFDDPMPAPAKDGRTGRVSAGCVFWMHGASRTFTTVPEDHGNCSVGSVTHGLKSLDEVAGNDDVGCLVEAGWVDPSVFPHIPTLKEKPDFITYGPLDESPVDPDVVLLRLNSKQAMIMKDAMPDIRIEGKPQCHIIPIAKELDQPAMSVGCMLSRVRTGMGNNEMTCALPARQLGGVIEKLRSACQADLAVADYASQDKTRFASG